MNIFTRAMILVVVITFCLSCLGALYISAIYTLDIHPIQIVQVDKHYKIEQKQVTEEYYNITNNPVVEKTEVIQPNLKKVGSGELTCAGTKCRMVYDK